MAERGAEHGHRPWRTLFALVREGLVGIATRFAVFAGISAVAGIGTAMGRGAGAGLVALVMTFLLPLLIRAAFSTL